MVLRKPLREAGLRVGKRNLALVGRENEVIIHCADTSFQIKDSTAQGRLTIAR
nr:MAG TPA: hypothetical protein [Caudoviricetes sp.]DAU83053.1 MAG TPA: hypothetical protein [Caudoviricetes sp.]